MITLDAIIDYIQCPKIYEYKHKQHLYIYADADAYETAMANTIFAIHEAIIKQRPLNNSEVKDIWGHNFDLQVEANDIIWMPHTDRRKMMINGLKYLVSANQHIQKTIARYTVEAIDTMHTFNTGQYEIALPYRYIYKNSNQTMLYIYYTKTRENNISHLDIYPYMVCQAYNDETNSKVNEIIYYSIHYNISKHELPALNMLNHVKHTLDTVCNLIHNDVFYYRLSSSSCAECLYRQYCSR